MTEARLVSSLEKCFSNDSPEKFAPLSRISVLKNERFSVQLLAKATGSDVPHRSFVNVKVDGAPCDFSVRTVECLPSALPCYPGKYDDNYISTLPGMYPDLLLPLGNGDRVPLVKDEARAYWITFEPDGRISGDFTVTVSLVDGNAVYAAESFDVRILDAVLPEQDIKVTQWFHGDCVAQYHDCDVFSRKWWRITENYVKVAVRNGINTFLTPVFTPPLDTAPGHERMTVQLADIRSDGKGEYTFDFAKLGKWLKMCDRCGIRYYEISHLFTQWGAAHAPKIMATENGTYKRIFGWETSADGEEYSHFLRTFIPALKEYMRKSGRLERCIFHISDEPNINDLDQYARSRAVVADLLDDCTVADALSSIDFYNTGTVKTPIPANNHIKPFINAGIKDLWTYYCCGQSVNVSNRYFAMPSCRNRCIGAQFFKYDIAGFLQWGYNFYNSQYSLSAVNPYLDTTANYFVPSGDAFSVYPGQNGEVYESLRLAVFHEALQDLSAFKLCASFIGKEKTVAVLESFYGAVKFDNCARTASTVLDAREAINRLIEENVRNDG